MRHEILPSHPDDLPDALFERLQYEFPEQRFDGLWVDGFRYSVCWPAVMQVSEEVRSRVLKWSADHHQLGSPPLEFLDSPPVNGHRLPERTVDDLVSLRGAFRNSRDLISDIAIALGPDFPPFRLRSNRPDYELHFKAELTQDQFDAVEHAVRSLAQPSPIVVVSPSDEGVEEWYERWEQGDIDIVPSRALGQAVPRAVRWLVEEDEEYWLTNRRSALVVGQESAPFAHVPDSWDTRKLRCVVDSSIYLPGNLRSYLTLYETVTLIPPVGDRFDEMLASLGITRDESIELLETGRLQVALPQSVDRYDADWMARATEAHPQWLFPSRRLACAMLADSRRRMPFLGPDIGIQERRALMELVVQGAGDSVLPQAVRDWFTLLTQELPDMWCNAPLALHREGAFQAPRYGLGWLGARLFEQATGAERILEVMKAAEGVEIAGALGAVAVPSSHPTGYDEQPYTDLIAAIGAPFGVGEVPVADAQEVKAVHGLLALDNDVPIIDFARTFTGADVDRLRVLVRDLAATNQDDDYLADAIKKYNAEVRQYERRGSRIRTFNVAGFGASVATGAGSALLAPASFAAVAPYASLGAWLFGIALARGAEPSKMGAVTGRLWDLANGLLAAEPPRAVLLSRLRSQLAVTKK